MDEIWFFENFKTIFCNWIALEEVNLNLGAILLFSCSLLLQHYTLDLQGALITAYILWIYDCNIDEESNK
jgi:hypothetical protein